MVSGLELGQTLVGIFLDYGLLTIESRILYNYFRKLFLETTNVRIY